MSNEARDPTSIVRERLSTGKLPKGGEARLTLNLGPIRPCDGCGSPITGMECIAELHDDSKLHFHGLCVETWQRERGASGDDARFVTPLPDWEGNSPAVDCRACGLAIPPFDGRFVTPSGSVHPGCYDRMHSDGRSASAPRDGAP
jgi:hypothetical protein